MLAPAAVLAFAAKVINFCQFGAGRIGAIHAENIARHPDAAALAKAQASRQPVVFADHSVEVDQSFDDLSLMRDLPGAMRSGEIELHYQPKLRSRTNQIDSAEGANQQ